jgi:hypothetical protein
VSEAGVSRPSDDETVAITDNIKKKKKEHRRDHL